MLRAGGLDLVWLKVWVWGCVEVAFGVGCGLCLWGWVGCLVGFGSGVFLGGYLRFAGLVVWVFSMGGCL